MLAYRYSALSLVAVLGLTPAKAIDLNDVEIAASAKPTFKTFGAPQDVYEYDLKLANLCGTSTSLNTVAVAWVGPKRTDFISDIRNQTFRDRSVALAAVVTFPDAKGDQPKQVKVPLVAMANFGDASVQNCDGTLVTDIPANARVRMHFEFKRSSTVKFNDPTKFIGGIAKVGSSATSLGIFGPSAGIVGTTVVPVVSYLTKNGGAITSLNEGVNDIMGSFSDVRSPDPRQYSLDSASKEIIYKSGRTPVMTISRLIRDSGPDTRPENGWAGVYSAFSARYGNLQDPINNAQTAVDSPWNANLLKFCSKLRGYLDNVTKGDKFATAIGIGFHAYYHAAEYNGSTCLNTIEIAKLKQRGWSAPYPNAWPSDAPTGAPVATSNSRRNAVLTSRTAFAFAH